MDLCGSFVGLLHPPVKQPGLVEKDLDSGLHCLSLIPISATYCCVTLGRFLDLSVPPFLSL